MHTKSARQWASRIILMLTCLITLTGCEVEWWNNLGPSDLDGRWRIVETGYNTNYRQGDRWFFYSNGDFESQGYQLNEQGAWERHGRYLYIYLTSYNEPDIKAYLVNYDDDYMTLAVDDYEYGRTTLRLVREAYLAPQKKCGVKPAASRTKRLITQHEDSLTSRNHR